MGGCCAKWTPSRLFVSWYNVAIVYASMNADVSGTKLLPDQESYQTFEDSNHHCHTPNSFPCPHTLFASNSVPTNIGPGILPNIRENTDCSPKAKFLCSSAFICILCLDIFWCRHVLQPWQSTRAGKTWWRINYNEQCCASKADTNNTATDC